QPGVDLLRPKQETKIRRMFLAGDWTDTGWPATMEGAVRSGYLAAEAVLRSAGTPRAFLQPDLPPDGVVVWLVGFAGLCRDGPRRPVHAKATSVRRRHRLKPVLLGGYARNVARRCSESVSPSVARSSSAYAAPWATLNCVKSFSVSQ